MLGVNEPEAQVVDVFVTRGRKVSVGDRLCTLETTKATLEVEAEVEGYIDSVLVAKGQQVTADEVLFEISSEPAAEPTASSSVSSASSPDPDVRPEGLLITEKGLRLAKELDLALDALPTGTLVTEGMVRDFSKKLPPPAKTSKTQFNSEIKASFDANELLIIGAGGLAKMIIDLVRQTGDYRIAGLVVEPLPTFSELLGVPVLGGEELLESLHCKGIRLMVNAVGAINQNRIRHEIFVRMVSRGFVFPALVHPKAMVEPSAEIAAGTLVFGMASVGSAARIGFGVIVNTGAIVSHDCQIGDLAHLTPGVVLAGSVEVGAGAIIGMGVTTTVGVKIGEWASIGNGARIHANVPPHAIVQAGTTWR
jgi:sugar O-acyltransferase (sialic acid O-acetyltransferase NeuD family)